MQKRTQEDHVREELGVQTEYDVTRVALPGIKELHTRSTADIAETLAIVLKSQAGIVEVRYKVGEFIELTSIPTNR